MRTKVINCGKYSCVHCSCEGQCCLASISITPKGECAQYKKAEGKTVSITEQDEHTNMC